MQEQPLVEWIKIPDGEGMEDEERRHGLLLRRREIVNRGFWFSCFLGDHILSNLIM